MDKEADEPAESDAGDEAAGRTRNVRSGGSELAGAASGGSEDGAEADPDGDRSDGRGARHTRNREVETPTPDGATQAAGSASEELAEQAEQIANGEMPDEDAEASASAGRDVDGELEDRNLIGTVLSDRYEIVSEIAKGGMGVVFRAVHQTLDRDVVVKVLRPEEVRSETARARFEREARRVCQLDHPNIVTVHDFGYHDSLAYLVMEYVDGVTVSDYIREHGPLSFVQFAPVCAAVLKGLAEAHRFDVVHRDIKAANIMLQIEDEELRRVKILDFGLAKLVEGGEGEDLTKQSELIGTVAAMAPERILGKGSDHRVDLYAVGVTAYRMLTGQRPFEGEDVRVLYQHVHDLPPLLSDHLPPNHHLPDTVVEFVHRLLAKDPDDRPDDAEQAKEWLYDTVEDGSIFRLDEQKVEWAQATGEQGNPSASGVTPTVPDWSDDEDTDSSSSYRSVITGRPDVEQLDLEEKADESGEFVRDAAAGDSEPIETKWLVTGVAVLAVAVVAVAYLATTVGGGSSGEAVAAGGSDVGAGSSAGAEADETEQPERAYGVVIDEIEQALENGNYGVAKSLIGELETKAQDQPSLMTKVAKFRTEMKVGRRLAEAKSLRKAGNIEKAVAEYEKVLSLQRNNETAKSQLEKLQSKVYLVVTSNVQGSVVIDGETIGETPVETYRAAESVTVEVRKSGYETWRKEISPSGGSEVELEATLSPEVRRTGGRAAGGGDQEESAQGGGGTGGGGADQESPSGKEGGSSDDFGGDSLMEMGPE